jgi:predicted lipoprotein with Yx(FWY)xxD motif
MESTRRPERDRGQQHLTLAGDSGPAGSSERTDDDAASSDTASDERADDDAASGSEAARPEGRRPGRGLVLVLRLAGAALLAATGAIHLDLYLTGYRTIPTIGWLFLAQVITAFALAAVILARGGRLAAAAGAGFALSTLGGYLLSVWVGLFGFTEVRTTAGIIAGVIEVAAFAVLALLAARPAASAPAASAPAPAPAGPAKTASAWMQSGVPGAGLMIAAVSAVAVALLAVALAGAGGQAPGPAAAGAILRTAKIHGVTVLTNARGFTLYWFAPDTAAKSRCYGSCAAYWPPVTGHPSAALGVTGRLGDISRAGGAVQATYDGHPLYTYIGDSAPGQASGNNLNLNGGLWHEVTASGR